MDHKALGGIFQEIFGIIHDQVAFSQKNTCTILLIFLHMRLSTHFQFGFQTVADDVMNCLVWGGESEVLPKPPVLSER